VRFVASRVSDTDAPRLRPAIAARVSIDKLASPSGISPGRYLVLSMLWRFGGQVEQERIAYAGLVLNDETAMPDDEAERLLLAAAEVGKPWIDAEAHINGNDLATHCEVILLESLAERFSAEMAARKAEQDDRAAIQLRTLEQRLGEERRRLRDTIESQRRRVSYGGSDARRASGALAMNEGKLRKLEERAAIRRVEIERGRKQTSQDEQLAIALIEVV
jgi:hypothetical protein